MISSNNFFAGLVVQGVSAIFPNGKDSLRALDNISFDICSQQFVCLLGPSGSGKSTLLRLLAGLLSPSQGEICYDGEVLHGPLQEVGFVFQKANLMPWRTVLQNILLPLEIQGLPRVDALRKANDLVNLVGLRDFEHAYPRQLSGGMAQRVSIARALVHDPDILLLDEPFGSLDALTRERMGAELLRIWQARQKMVVMVTHSISEALFLADRVLVLTSRPGSLQLDLLVDLPRPRNDDVRYTPRFGELARQLRAAIG